MQGKEFNRPGGFGSGHCFDSQCLWQSQLLAAFIVFLYRSFVWWDLLGGGGSGGGGGALRQWYSIVLVSDK